MRGKSRTSCAAGLLALASCASAQVASVCPSTNVCFQLNIPESTASSGSGDIFFQISAPSSYEWVALGQGRGMVGSNIFIVYTSSGGSNVTLSPRLASGYSEPDLNADAEVSLLEGSGVANGVMTANVKCSNCNSWSGGSMDFREDSANWIYGYRSSGGPKNSNDQSAGITVHSEKGSFSWNFASAKGGNSVNPLLSAAPSGSGSGTATATSCIPRAASATTASSGANPTQTSDDNDDWQNYRTKYATWKSAWPTARPTSRPSDASSSRHAKRQEDLPYCDELTSGSGSGNTNAEFTPISSFGGGGNRRTMLIAHGVLAALAFVILFPSGAIAIRLASFTGVVWLHAAFQVFAFLVYIAAFGLGVYLATEMNMIDHHHPIIGIVVLVLLFFQPILGFLHHLFFKKYTSRTLWSYAHIWTGRIAVTIGIINGGLGLRWADSMGLSSKGGIIAYGVIAGLVWVVWVAAIVVGESRRKRAIANAPPKDSGSPRQASLRSDEAPVRSDEAPVNGHYAPKQG